MHTCACVRSQGYLMSAEAVVKEDYSLEKALAVCDESIDCSDSPTECECLQCYNLLFNCYKTAMQLQYNSGLQLVLLLSALIAY